ncbi:MAG: hypothetical protein HOC74_35895 [Gemmatimonadetes bacterium]|jgi:hypothetical protein|nr:hypothetical protein [Gemmatimonadota bacterium]
MTDKNLSNISEDSAGTASDGFLDENLTLDLLGPRSGEEPDRLHLVANHPEIGRAFTFHCFECGPFALGCGEKREDGSVRFHYTGSAGEEELTCIATFEPRLGGRISMEVEVDGPVECLKEIHFIDGCMQHWDSPAFKRRGALSEFAGRCFVYTMRGPTSLLETARGKHKESPDSQWNNPACTQWHVDFEAMHPGDIWGFGTCADRPVHGVIGATSRDGKWLTAMGRRYNLSIGQGWHDCLHTGGHTRWYVDEKVEKIRQKTVLYVMPNDREKLLAAYLEDFPPDVAPVSTIPTGQEGLREPRPGARTGTRLKGKIRGETLCIEPAQGGAPVLECSFAATGDSGGMDAASWEETYWGTYIRRGMDWRMWAHPVGNALEVCVSLDEARWKDGAHTTVFMEGGDWIRVQGPEGVPATVFCAQEGRWTAAFFWERPEKEDVARGIPQISEPGGRSLSIRGRLCLYKGSPEALVEQWKWASDDWMHEIPYRMPATDEPVIRPEKGVTFAPDSQLGAELRYGLTIEPPWGKAGHLHVNFPEHLEYDDEEESLEGDYTGYSILRHHDEIEYPWEISPDARSARFKVESPHLSGVEVEGCVTANGPVAVWWMRIVNGSSEILPRIKPLFCFQYGALEGFPQHQDNFQYTHFFMDGKLVRLAEVKTANPDRDAMVAYAKGSPQHDCDKFANGRGGLVDKPIDCAVAAITSLDGERKIVLAGDPPKSVLSNAYIPCLHADPYFGTLKPGESSEISGAALFTEGDLEEAMNSMAQKEWLRGTGEH